MYCGNIWELKVCTMEYIRVLYMHCENIRVIDALWKC